MQNDLPKEQQDNWDDPDPKGGWLLIIFFLIPWVLGVGVVSMVLLDLIGVKTW